MSTTKSSRNKLTTEENPIVTEAKVAETIKEVETTTPKKVSKCYGAVLPNTLLNVREEASMNAKILGTLSANTKVEIVDDSNSEFYHIKTKEFIGYCKKDFIKLK